MAKPVLLFGYGNLSRGDDALGPLLLEYAESHCDLDEIEVLTDFQLQIEHALDLQDRRAVLFVDAARPGACAGVALSPIEAGAAMSPFTHALSASALLEVAVRVVGGAPPAWQLAIEGESFELGQGLSPGAASRLPQAVELALDWLRQLRAAAA
jgi:hydrogenase maturation protease